MDKNSNETPEQFNDYLRNMRIQQFENNKTKEGQIEEKKIIIEERKKFFEENNEEEVILLEPDSISSDKKHGKLEHDMLNQKGVKKDIFFSYPKADVENMMNNYEIVKKFCLKSEIANSQNECVYDRAFLPMKKTYTYNISNIKL